MRETCRAGSVASTTGPRWTCSTRHATWRLATKPMRCAPWRLGPGRPWPPRDVSRRWKGGRQRLDSASPCPRGGGCGSRRGGPLPTRRPRAAQDRRQPHRPSSAGGGARSASYGAGRGRSGAGSTGTARHHPPPGGAARNTRGTHFQQGSPPLPSSVLARNSPTPPVSVRSGCGRVPWLRLAVLVRPSALRGRSGWVMVRGTTYREPSEAATKTDIVQKIFRVGSSNGRRGR